jgi:hypothetical protein
MKIYIVCGLPEIGLGNVSAFSYRKFADIETVFVSFS